MIDGKKRFLVKGCILQFELSSLYSSNKPGFIEGNIGCQLIERRFM